MLTISRTRLLAGAAALALTASLGATPGLAQDATMDVTATVAQDCSVTVDGPLAFGDIIPGDDGNASSGFTIDCAAGEDVNVEIDNGNHSTGTDRRMVTQTTAGDVFLPYVILDLATGGAWTDKTVVLTDGSAHVDLDGFVSGTDSGNAALGEYSDQVTITLVLNGDSS